MSNLTSQRWFADAPTDSDIDADDWPMTTVLVLDETSGIVCEVRAHTSPEITVAHARLIAQSPRLLASLETLSEWMRSSCGPGDGVHDMLVEAVTAIQDAGGEIR